MSLSARRAWIEIFYTLLCVVFAASLSARRAWIEISLLPPALWAVFVALRKESVDRNEKGVKFRIYPNRSLSARRAWIEMCTYILSKQPNMVALRKESVDRNSKIAKKVLTSMWSLSARRAWIEILSRDADGVYLVGRSPQGERG